MDATSRIIAYYDNTVSAYEIVWRLASALGLHYGFWDDPNPNTLTLLRHSPLIRAIKRQDQRLADWANIAPNSRVLDAGCGIGGSAIYLALEKACNVVGITLSAKQVAQASELASKYRVSQQTRFQVCDYTNTPFLDDSFDVVWAIESVCHATNKPAFCREAFRLLPTDGKLVVADYFVRDERLNTVEQHLLNSWLNGWAIDQISTRTNFEHILRQTGFSSVEYRDVTEQIRPSSRRLYLFYHFTTKILRPIVVSALRLNWWGLNDEVERQNIEAARCQYEALQKGLWRYGVFIAKK